MERVAAVGPIFSGVVIQGRGRSGPILDHPTFNLLPKEAVVLRHGTYLATASHGDLTASALLYWGTRPTMAKEEPMACHLHLLGDTVVTFDKAYHIEVQIEGFLRPDQRFANPGELRQQLRADREAARRWFMRKQAPSRLRQASLACGAI